jgi:hypothetical protein
MFTVQQKKPAGNAMVEDGSSINAGNALQMGSHHLLLAQIPAAMGDTTRLAVEMTA